VTGPDAGSLENALDRARELDTDTLADAIESIGFECTRCGACCKAVETDEGREDHTATVFPDEIRRLQRATTEERTAQPESDDAIPYDWRDIARPMPYGLQDGAETFEWALQTDECGDCVFYEEKDDVGACTVHPDRPLICQTYPFSIGPLSGDGSVGALEPMGSVVDREGIVRAHECEGLGRDISREDAEELAAALKERAIRELEEAIGVRDNYDPVDVGGVVVHDSEGQKRPDGTAIGDEQ